jgi:two-component system response regulator AtoC
MSVRILLIDADEAQRDGQLIALSAVGYEATPAQGLRQALALIQAAPPDIICCDVRVPGIQGPDCFREITRRAPEASVLATFASEDRELAIEATQRGAFDILEKPLQPDALRLCLGNAHARTQRNRQNYILSRELARFVGGHSIVAASGSMIELLESLEQAASHQKTVLLTGEAGTGKEILARAIHAQSDRRNENFVTANCATRPSNRLAAQLFGDGHAAANAGVRPRRGLITDADHGTLFLDHVSEFPESIQTQLAHWLQEDPPQQPATSHNKRVADVRFIASTSENLEEVLASGRLSEDLHSQLCEVHLHAPPLRERQEDIPLLVDHYLERYGLILSSSVRGIADDALERLVTYRWPGNVRELENICQRAIMLAREDRITVQDLPREVASRSAEPEERVEDLGLKRGRRAVEIDLIRRALRSTGGNRTHAAKRLEISHRTLLYKIKEYGVRD